MVLGRAMSTRSLATELTPSGGIPSAWSVTNLLSEEGFRLQSNPGKLSAAQRSANDTQFAYINGQEAIAAEVCGASGGHHHQHPPRPWSCPGQGGQCLRHAGTPAVEWK